ncbi:hypothetical protein K439DRAFT_1649750 [Ramaria rubella]|nr:hypothetical protein K439DRAFT_1649750 [Ramaria rubella]
MLLWIQNSLSPLEIRARVMDPTSDFQRTLVEYLERSHQGEFLNGTMEDVKERIDSAKDVEGYKDPTTTLPVMPPLPCIIDDIWWQKFYGETCKKNKWRTCKAQFPRELHQHSEVDPKTGHINLKKGEAWINTFTPIVTYLLRCNSDVTSLLSGTAIKAVTACDRLCVSKPSQNIWYI